MKSFSHNLMLRVLGVWLVVIVQLHLLFVVELHQHRTDLLPDHDSAAVAGSRTHVQPAQREPAPLCAACQVVRQGSIQLASTGLFVSAIPQARSVVLAPVLDFSYHRPLVLAGRAPPISF